MSVSLLVPDLHIGRSTSLGKPGIGASLNSRIVDQLNLLDWVKRQAEEHNARQIITTGDIFHDTKPHPTLITLFIGWLKDCHQANIDVHLVRGNHDLMRSGQFSMSALDIIAASEMEGVCIHQYPNTIEVGGAAFTLLPFRDRRSFNVASNAEAISLLKAKLPYELSSIGLYDAKLMVGHLAIESSIFVGDEIDDMQNELFCPMEMFAGYDGVWMGHIHKYQSFTSPNQHIAHLGSLDLSDFGEADQTKVIAIVDPKKSQFYQYLEVPTRPLKQIAVSVPEQITDTTSFVLQEIKESHRDVKKAIVRVNILLNNKDVVSVRRSEVEQCLTELGAFHTVRINEERKIEMLKKEGTENIDREMTEKMALQTYANANVEEEMRSDFIKLAQSVIQECNE